MAFLSSVETFVMPATLPSWKTSFSEGLLWQMTRAKPVIPNPYQFISRGWRDGAFGNQHHGLWHHSGQPRTRRGPATVRFVGGQHWA